MTNFNAESLTDALVSKLQPATKDYVFTYAQAVELVRMAYEEGRPKWRPIGTAPKSLVKEGSVHGEYLLGYVPDDSLDPKACMSTIWWEPLTRCTIGKRRGLMGTWFGEGSFEVEPTHWMPLPETEKSDD